MIIFFVIPGAIYSLNTPALVLTILLVLATGYYAKLLFDKYKTGSGITETNELQLELETLQNKFRSEILRKEEVELMLQNELKAAEKRHLELQVQYAKALTYIEQIRKGNVKDTDHVETEACRQILQNLQDKIARQERSLLELELELQLRNTEQKKPHVNKGYEQLRENNTSKKLRVTGVHNP